jgi:hypothetical protein
VQWTGLSNPAVPKRRGLITPSFEEGLLAGSSRSSILKVIIYKKVIYTPSRHVFPKIGMVYSRFYVSDKS